MIVRILVFVLFCFVTTFSGKAQSESVRMDSVVEMSVKEAQKTADQIVSSADSLPQVKQINQIAFKPNPKKAVLFSIVPGLGQIYNRKYWKLPIVYGAFMGCIYAVTWNNRSYKDYSTAYKDIMGEDVSDPSSWHTSWQDLIPAGGDPSSYVNNENFKTILKSRKDYYRRYRDLSIIITVGVYALCMIDAYVDAQLFDFDISPDLSMRVEPVVTPKTSFSSRTYGLNCSLKF